MGGPQECYGFAPTFYEGQQDPLSIRYCWYTIIVYCALLLIFVAYDYRSRRIVLSGNAPTDAKEITLHQIFPIFFWGIIVYFLSNGIIGGLMNIILFEGLRTASDSSAREMACYIQWYPDGSLLYLSMVLYTSFVLLFTSFFHTAYPRLLKRHAEKSSYLLRCCPEQVKSEKELSLLYIGASAGDASVLECSELNSSGSVYRDRVHMTIVEKFGSKSGEQVGIEKKVVDSLISYNKLESKISCVDLPCSENWASPKYLNLDALPDEGFDFVQVTSQFQNWLGVSFDSKNSFIRKSRYVNAFLEVYRVLKNDGYFVKVCSSAAEMEEERYYLRQAGFITAGHESLGESQSIEICGTKLAEWGGSNSFSIVAKKPPDANDEESGAELRSSVVEDNRTSLAVVRAKEDLEDPPLTKQEWQLIWVYFLIMSQLAYAGIFVVTVVYFCEMRFPLQVGFSNYFNWNMLSIVGATPMNIIFFLTIMYFHLSRLPQVTSKIVWNMGWTFFILQYLLGMIFSIPKFIFSVGISYYLVDRMFGIDVNTVMNNVVTGIIVGVLIRGALYLVRRLFHRNTVAIGPQEFDFVFDPAYAKPVRTNTTITPLHVDVKDPEKD